ncbi:hypothetical protein J4476_04040 [Candidatus Woesearchaeota archaeon]|nr:MAG: hypothetical protein QT09_C0009G0029 [archaeon GW2011_AR18]MBS3161835.1 hypothetical protein [Candidatus Woesearchaeota archaeon]HIH26051.1 hypothetical protein [Nanoarchaeota archaeon]
MNISDNLKKNLLDLEYNKNLQYFNTCLVIIFTYLIGLIFAILSRQVDISNFLQLVILIIFTLVFLLIMFYFLIDLKTALNRIVKEIKELKI